VALPGNIGRMYMEVHADTSAVAGEVDRNLSGIADDADGELDKTGKKFGDKISDSTVTTIRKRGKDFAKAIGDSTRNVVVRVRSKFDFDGLGNSIRRLFRRDVGRTITEEVDDALSRAGSRGGIFSKIGQGVADAIGAGFNVSGKSPLIAVLLPALAALVGVILAALQAVNALVAVLIVLPSILASVVAQIGVVAIAFQGIGTAVQGAFAAKNAKELNKALKDLQPSARFFVKTLLPLKPFFKELQDIVQQNFFSRLGNVMLIIQKALGPSFMKGMGRLAKDMGTFFRSLGLFFASPTFVKFVNEIFPATGRWMQKFGPALVTFLKGLFDMANAAMPFLNQLGDMVAGFLTLLGLEWTRFAKSPEFQQWLDDMADTLKEVFGLLSETFNFLMVFLAQLNRAGGQNVITALSEALSELSFFLASPVGLKAMEGLVDLGIAGIKTFAGMLIAILAVIAAAEVFGEWVLNTAGPAVIRFFKMVGQAAVDFSTFIGVWIQRILGGIWNFIVGVGRGIRDFWNDITGATRRFIGTAQTHSQNFINFMKAIPGKIRASIGNLGDLLVNSGRALINGLINGVKQRLGALFDMLLDAARRIGGIFGLSPAKEGALSGRGYMLYRGQHLMQDFIKGMNMEVPNLRAASLNATSNIVFGPNSIQMQFTGPTPDQQQARTTGSAMGMAAANMIAARNTRLAVRTL
jgi:hypothetical protein